MASVAKKTTLGDWLDKKFVEWQVREGGRQTIVKFCEYLGVSRPAFDKWSTNPRHPSKESIELLSDKLGDEIYEVLGLESPNPVLQRIRRGTEKMAGGEMAEQKLKRLEKYVDSLLEEESVVEKVGKGRKK